MQISNYLLNKLSIFNLKLTVKTCLIGLLFAVSFNSSASQNDADQAGKVLFEQQCIACHGKKGQGNQALKAPNLAGMDSWYIEKQLEAFKAGYRGTAEGDSFGAGMAAISKSLNAKDISKLAGFINTLPKDAKATKTVEGDQEKGKQFYQSLCGSCHGPGGKGNKALNAPKLAGLADWYLVEQLNKFRNGKRGYHQDDRLGRQMKMMSGILPDDQAIKDVSVYLSAQ